jgi:acetyl esterase/lipase
VTVSETYAGGVRAYWNDAPSCAIDRVLLFTHGGGYSIMSPKSHERLAGHLAKAAGCRVLNIDYRLAPEHTHPAPVNDGLSVYRWLLEQGYEHSHIAVSGDSAGGGLALATLVAIRNAGLPQPATAVLFSPWADLELTGESMVTRLETDLLVNMEQLKYLAASFVGPNGSTRDPLASPLYADFAGLAPIYVQVGGDETLLDDARRVTAKAQAAGVEARLDVFPECSISCSSRRATCQKRRRRCD